MNVTAVVEYLSDLQWSSDHTLFYQFVSTLVLDKSQDIQIIFHLVDHYVSISNFRQAVHILASTGRAKEDTEDRTLEDIHETLLAIARARIYLRTTGNAEEALELKRKLDVIKIYDQGLHASNDSRGKDSREQWIKFKLHRSLLWSDLRKTGHVSKSANSHEVESWVGEAIGYLRLRDDIAARRLELAILATFPSVDPDERAVRLQWSRELILRCPDHSIEKVHATRLYALTILGTSRAEGMSLIIECQKYYKTTENREAQLGMDIFRILLDVKTSDKLTQYLTLGRKCLDLGHLALAQSCVEQAESHTRNLTERWSAFEKIGILAEEVFRSTGDIWSANEYEVSRCCARTFSPPQGPRDPADLRAAISMMQNTREKIKLTPSQDHAIWKMMGDCAKELMRFNLLDECESILLEHEYTKLDYEKLSLIINDYSASTHTRIVARYNHPLTDNLREDIYQSLQEEIEKLERSFDRDEQHKFSTLAKIKLERLVMYYDTIDLRHPERRAFAKMSKRSCYSRYQRYRGATPMDTLIEKLGRQDGFANSSAVEIADRNLEIITTDPDRNDMQLAEAFLLCAIARESTLDTGSLQDSQLTISQDVMVLLERSRKAAKLADPTGISLMRIVTTLLRTTSRLIHLDKVKKMNYLRDVHTILFEIEEAIIRQRGSASTNDLPMFMENRRLETNYMRRGFYRQVEQFYFELNLLGDWWAWHEKARSRTLNSRLRQVSNNDFYKLPKDAAELEKSFSQFFANAAAMDDTLNLVVVDFHFSDRGKLSLIAINSTNRVFRTATTGLTRDFIESWYQIVMKDPVRSLKNGSYLQELRTFAAAIEEITTENDVIYLIPPYPLDQFPLHAASIQDKSLLERNTILHATSLTSLLHCFEVSEKAQAVRLKESMVFRHAYDRSKEQTKILQSHQSLCKILELDPPTEQVKKAVFQHDLQYKTWIHFHGHVTSLLEGPLNQAFVLQDDKLTVGEILSQHNLNTNSAIIAIGCGSGAQDNNEANEQLGLSPVLINAGAVIVLSTLWKVDSSAGRVFSEKFYQAINHQIKEMKESEKFINVAQALRIAIVNLKNHRGSRSANERFDDANHWAAYIMHGSPFFKIDQGRLPPR